MDDNDPSHDDSPSTEGTSSHRLARLVSAGAFISVLVATDLLLNFFCSFWPLVIYLAVGGLGAWRGGRLHRRLIEAEGVVPWGYKVRAGLAVFSAVGLITLFILPVNWDTKCSWRYCGRAMGPGLFSSPFPVGTPSCGKWMTCANEYPYSASEYRALLRRMEKQGCPAP